MYMNYYVSIITKIRNKYVIIICGYSIGIIIIHFVVMLKYSNRVERIGHIIDAKTRAPESAV